MAPGIGGITGVGKVPQPEVTLRFAAHDEYVDWIALHRSTGSEMAENKVREAIFQSVMAVTSEEALVVATCLRTAILSGWEEGPELQQARQAMAFVCGMSRLPGTEEPPAAEEAATGAAPAAPGAPATPPPPAAAPPPAAGPAPVPGGPRA